MLFRDRPLLVDGLDEALYLTRPELERRLTRPVLQHRNVLLLGEAGSGKSTLLRKAASVLEQLHQPAVLVNASVAPDAQELLRLADAALTKRLGPGDPGSPGPDLSPGGLLAGARRLARPIPATILVDGLLDAQIGYDVFGRLRDELWQLGHTWVVAVRPRDSAALRTPPADAFWGTVVEIPKLTGAEIDRLLRLGLDEDEYGRIDHERAAVAAHPRSVIRDVQSQLEDEAGTATVTPAEVLRRADGLGRSEAMAMAELQGLGRPASAHDAELLRRLGWSRPYAQRILSRLEDEGLLRSIPERGERAGRPRKLYEPTPTPEWE